MFLDVMQLYSALLVLKERLNDVGRECTQAMLFPLWGLQSGKCLPLATTTTHLIDRQYHISLSS
jgi:hypothetical protein